MMVLPFKQLVLVDLLQKTLGFQPVGLVQQLEYLDKCALVNMEKDIWDIYIYIVDYYRRNKTIMIIRLFPI